MSIGNLKDYGNKGNNFPFQLKVLQGITNILAAMTGTSIVINPKVRTANIKRSNSTGTVVGLEILIDFAFGARYDPLPENAERRASSP
jgi:hypothetical protein